MQDLGRVTTKIKLGGGLNLLCVAGAGYVTVKTLTKIVELSNAIKQGEVLEGLLNNCRELNEVLKKKSEEDAKEEVAE